MEQNKLTEFRDPYFEEVQAKTKLSFDFVLWFYRILKYWYLFVISLILFLGYAYIKNKSFTAFYTTSATVMIEPRGNTVNVASSAVPYNNIRNINNQQMVLSSRKLVENTIEKLPQLQVKYFDKTRFKSTNLYGFTPISIECNYIAPSAYNYNYKIEPIDTERCRVSYQEAEETPVISTEIPYGQFVQESRFFIRIKKTEQFIPNFKPFYFRFATKQELVGYYSGRIRTSVPATGSSAIIVSVIGDNSIQDRAFLSKLLEEFRENNLNLKNEASDNTIRFIDHQLSIINDSLSISENTFQSFQNQTGIYGIESDENRQKMRDMSSRMSELKAKEKIVLILTDTIKNTIVNNGEIINPSSLGLDIVQGNSNLSTLVNDYNTIAHKMRNSSIGRANPIYERSEKELLTLKIRILEALKGLMGQVQNEQEETEQERIDLERRLSVLPAQEREFLRYQSQYNLNEQYSTYLTQKRYEAEIQKSSNVPDNYVLEPPKQEGGPINANTKTDTYLMCLVIGLALPLAFVVCKEEFFNFSISTKEECERISGMPVIATIENVAKKINTTGGRFLVKNLPKSSFAESFRNMRIRIEYMAQREFPICLLVTSAEPADGKTFIASNIASVYQLTGKRVILIDFDLRRPSVAKNLGIHSKKGVSNFLIGQVSLEEVTLTHPEYGFDIITAGTLPPNPSELIRTKKTKDMITYLRANYDYIIMDCSPIGLVSDAYILSKMVDATLFVVRRGKTNKAFFKSVVTQVRNDGLEHFALIFNDVKGREGYYGTSRYYGDKSYYMRRNSYYHDDYFEK